MNIVKSALAACFISAASYFLAVLFVPWIGVANPFGSGRAMGINVVLAYARSPITLLIGFGAFVLSFWFFVKH